MKYSKYRNQYATLRLESSIKFDIIIIIKKNTIEDIVKNIYIYKIFYIFKIFILYL